jgi:hypothetical protein
VEILPHPSSLSTEFRRQRSLCAQFAARRLCQQRLAQALPFLLLQHRPKRFAARNSEAHPLRMESASLNFLERKRRRSYYRYLDCVSVTSACKVATTIDGVKFERRTFKRFFSNYQLGFLGTSATKFAHRF